MHPKHDIIWKFKKLWKFYLLQTILASLAIALIIFILGTEKIVLISAMAATTFIVFAMPKADSAQTRNVLGGHLVGLLCGGLFYYLKLYYPDLPPQLVYPITVGLAIFLMVALDFEHPPAAGTALSVVVNEMSLDAAIIIMTSALILSQIRYLFRHYLRDLV
jgi:CBS-domain-containing membrane protein